MHLLGGIFHEIRQFPRKEEPNFCGKTTNPAAHKAVPRHYSVEIENVTSV